MSNIISEPIEPSNFRDVSLNEKVTGELARKPSSRGYFRWFSRHEDVQRRWKLRCLFARVSHINFRLLFLKSLAVIFLGVPQSNRFFNGEGSLWERLSVSIWRSNLFAITWRQFPLELSLMMTDFSYLWGLFHIPLFLEMPDAISVVYPKTVESEKSTLHRTKMVLPFCAKNLVKVLSKSILRRLINPKFS